MVSGMFWTSRRKRICALAGAEAAIQIVNLVRGVWCCKGGCAPSSTETLVPQVRLREPDGKQCRYVSLRPMS